MPFALRAHTHSIWGAAAVASVPCEPTPFTGVSLLIFAPIAPAKYL